MGALTQGLQRQTRPRHRATTAVAIVYQKAERIRAPGASRAHYRGLFSAGVASRTIRPATDRTGACRKVNARNEGQHDRPLRSRGCLVKCAWADHESEQRSYPVEVI